MKLAAHRKCLATPQADQEPSSANSVLLFKAWCGTAWHSTPHGVV